ncbi:hypothetical protein HYALB_00008855 [Hymenoscyphus albidus]|uniref:SRR1-like domain-containing protein n=1 Tax=Hymenoscyphus albidus TaxID=595503 RepID=A0A9N9LR71_9HELO|nr:hypothetical protein HYALB_00008855 [Hymenoscyphus albidus]
MGNTVIYNEETDYITVKDGDTTIRDEPAMNYKGLSIAQQFLSEINPSDKEIPTDYKSIREALAPKNSKIEQVPPPWPTSRHLTLHRLKVFRRLVAVDGLNMADTAVDVQFQFCSNGTLDDLDAVFQKEQAEFLATPDCAFLVEALEKIKQDKRLKITNVMILGSGSMDTPFVDPELHTQLQMDFYKDLDTARAAKQIAATIKISEDLGEPGNPLPISAQEIVYSNLEKDFLSTKLGITVLDDPDAISLINNGTLIFAAGAPYNLFYWISQGKWPGAMITTNLNPARLARHFTPAICTEMSWMWGHYDGFFISNRVYIEEGGNVTPVENARGMSTFCAWAYHDFLWVNRYDYRNWAPMVELVQALHRGELKPVKSYYFPDGLTSDDMLRPAEQDSGERVQEDSTGHAEEVPDGLIEEDPDKLAGDASDEVAKIDSDILAKDDLGGLAEGNQRDVDFREPDSK